MKIICLLLIVGKNERPTAGRPRKNRGKQKKAAGAGTVSDPRQLPLPFRKPPIGDGQPVHK
jgi:hypothetical protein